MAHTAGRAALSIIAAMAISTGALAQSVSYAASAVDTASDKAAQTTTKLINNLQDINFVSIALVVGVTSMAIWVIRRMLPYLAQRGPTQFRLYLLGGSDRAGWSADLCDLVDRTAYF